MMEFIAKKLLMMNIGNLYFRMICYATFKKNMHL